MEEVPSTSIKSEVTNRFQEVSSTTMVRCKTADLIGNLRRKGHKYFHSDSEDSGEDVQHGENSGNGENSGSGKVKKDSKEKEEETGSSNSSEYDEVMICNVCDRSFRTVRQLIQHQSTKRHFECSVCHQLFPSLFDVKQHKESLNHWTPDDDKSAVGIPIDGLIQITMGLERRGSQTKKSSNSSFVTSSESSTGSNPFPSDERLL